MKVVLVHGNAPVNASNLRRSIEEHPHARQAQVLLSSEGGRRGAGRMGVLGSGEQAEGSPWGREHDAGLGSGRYAGS